MNKKISELNQREFDNYEIIKAALIRQRNENIKTEKYIRQQREMIQINMAQLSHIVHIMKDEIASYKDKNSETEERLLERFNYYESKLKDKK